MGGGSVHCSKDALSTASIIHISSILSDVASFSMSSSSGLYLLVVVQVVKQDPGNSVRGHVYASVCEI